MRIDLFGSLAFATALAGAGLIVVLGHGARGAVSGAVDGARLVRKGRLHLVCAMYLVGTGKAACFS